MAVRGKFSIVGQDEDEEGDEGNLLRLEMDESLGLHSPKKTLAKKGTFCFGRAGSNCTLLVAALIVFLWVLSLVLVYRGAKSSGKEEGHNSSQQQHGSSASLCLSKECLMLSAQVLNSLDESTDPCEDFYQYACGNWIAWNPVPDDQSKIDRFSTMEDANDLVVRKYLEDPQGTTPAHKFYGACLKTRGDRANFDSFLASVFYPLSNLTANWASASSTWALRNSISSNVLPMFEKLGIAYFLGMDVGMDDKNVSFNSLFISQSGLGLPTKDYYLNKNISTDKNLIAYRELIGKAFQHVGYASNVADSMALGVISFETSLAKIFEPSHLDPEAAYNFLSESQLQVIAPVILWSKYFDRAFLFQPPRIIAVHIHYLSALSGVINATAPSDLQSYFLWRSYSPFLTSLGSDLEEIYFDFRTVLTGVSVPLPLWQKCLTNTVHFFGFYAGRGFVDTAFSPDNRKAAQDMVDELLSAFHTKIETFDWLSPATKSKSLDKLAMIIDKIGYPDWIMDDSLLAQFYANISVSSLYFNNTINALSYFRWKEINSLNLPVDRGVWEMFPSVVNAYYNPAFNEIVFPAGILQPPFFHHSYPMAFNFGGIGSVIGHEMTHGFDNNGRQYDKYGNMELWWDQQSIDQFNKLASCFVDEYKQFVVEGPMGLTLNVDGNLTLGENIADNGGISTSFLAYKAWCKKFSDVSLPGFSNFTSDQSFFLAYSQTWCANDRPEDAYVRAQLDPHSPSKYRVNGVLSNNKDFASAFKCPVGSSMNPTTKCSVW